MSRIKSSLSVVIASLIAALTMAACGGGGGGTGSSSSGSNNNGSSSGSNETTPGVWQGTIASPTTGNSSVVGLTNSSGHSVWMTTDGRVWSGQMPMTGDHFDTNITGHMYPGVASPTAPTTAPWSMMANYSATGTSGRFNGTGDAGTFSFSMHPMWDRPASIRTVAGVYTRSTSIGYTMTMTMSSQRTAHRQRLPWLPHQRRGQRAGRDAQPVQHDRHRDVVWIAQRHLQRHGRVARCRRDAGLDDGHASLQHGGGCGGIRWLDDGRWLADGGRTRLQHGARRGQHNLFMFSLANDHNAIMDALAR